MKNLGCKKHLMGLFEKDVLSDLAFFYHFFLISCLAPHKLSDPKHIFHFPIFCFSSFFRKSLI